MSVAPARFEALYARNPDPWGFETSDYEHRKYDHTLRALPRARYRHGLEVGCSIGVLTACLAGRCDALTAVDGAETALNSARRRCAEMPSVDIRAAWVPGDWPDTDVPYDLFVLSEVLYYLDHDDIGRLVARMAASAAPIADILAVHWTGATDHPLSGDAAIAALMTALGPAAAPLRQERRALYRLDLFRLRSERR
ncbi:methyltransferase domain-containing protein [Roseomonas hellenica]|uniref:Methyltransferase domain-containing protein n=1 Tax=Plastoroseomonas hellenica TaxID=2687306 RepID=A0ABS5EYT9_9PROT|nr:SAM-dependent methyltransferase [Plastoroseomonas hellenica]MBR0665459.1 methyltransferase domain-containing protein [Plastoroseomonas hellenica]